MMRKFFVTMMLAVALVLVSSQAEAREVYVGTYSDGTAVYLLTETVRYAGRNTSISFWATVRAGSDYIDYTFEGNMYTNSEGYSGNINDGYSPVARAIYNYCMKR